MPRQNSGSRGQQEHIGKHSLEKTPQKNPTNICKGRRAITTILCPLQFLLLPLSTWSPCTLRFPASHLIGCSVGESGCSRRWTPTCAVAIPQAIMAWWLLATWASAKLPSLLVLWHSVVMETECGQVLLETRPCLNVRSYKWCLRSYSDSSCKLWNIINYEIMEVVNAHCDGTKIQQNVTEQTQIGCCIWLLGLM